MAVGRPGRYFSCRAVLLYWTGDYPAQAAVSGTHSKQCHWCSVKSVNSPEITRRCWDRYRRYLGPQHSFRMDVDRFGSVETDEPPPTRTHAQYVDDAYAQQRYRGFAKYQPYKTTGVKEVSPLHFLPLFDIVWDVMPDMMHIVPDLFKGHIVPMLRGQRDPAKVRARKTWTAERNEALLRQHAKAKEHLKTWTLSEVRFILISLNILSICQQFVDFFYFC